jgi:hypothetical protein
MIVYFRLEFLTGAQIEAALNTKYGISLQRCITAGAST